MSSLSSVLFHCVMFTFGFSYFPLRIAKYAFYSFQQLLKITLVITGQFLDFASMDKMSRVRVMDSAFLRIMCHTVIEVFGYVVFC